MEGPGWYFADTGSNPQQLRDQILAGRHSAAETIVQRGEVDASLLEPRLVSLPFDLFRHEVLMTLQPVSAEAIERIVDGIVMPLLTRQTDSGRSAPLAK